MIDANTHIMLVSKPAQDNQNEPVTITNTTSRGAPDFIPTLIPALQSSAYILVILGGFLAWSSRKLFVDFCQKHITLVETLKDNLDAQLVTTRTQMEVLERLAANNAKLVDTVTTIAERNNQQLTASRHRDPSGNL